jgi:cytochrome c oxidase subunit 2
MRQAHFKFISTLPAATFLLTSCSGEVSGLGFEEGVSSVNDQSLSLWQGAWIAAAVVGVFTLILILWPIFFHRKKDESFPILKISPDNQVSHFIDVNGFQWSWQFKYKDAGDYKSATVTGTPAQPPTLYLPLGENVRFTLTANDVVHGFWIPAFMIQMQNLPGVTNQLEFSATKLGTFPGRCNILCGRNHSQMLFNVKVVTPAEYESYIQSLVAEEKAVIS